MTSTWTFGLDESGDFEEERRGGLVVGGPLLPAAASDFEADLRDRLRKFTSPLPYPPHASEMRVEDREQLLSFAARIVRELNGRWLFVVARPTASSPRERLGEYVRWLGTVVDLAARFAALGGARALDVIPAQRSVPIDPSLESDAKRAGRIVETEEGTRVRAASEIEVRLTLDALQREAHGWSAPHPGLGEVSVRSASDPGAHPIVLLADVAANALYRATTRRADIERVVSALGETRFLLLDAPAATHLRQIDRALRESPPDLVRAARHVEDLRGRSAADDWEAGVRAHGGLTAERLFTEGLCALETTSRRSPADTVSSARALAGQAEAALAVKSGAYDAVWRALEAGWAGDSELARRARACGDLELGARLWRLTAEGANHRGDVRSARAAIDHAEGIFARARSFRLRAEQQQVENLACGALQNELPAPDDAVSDIVEALRVHAERLVELAHDAGQITRRDGDDAAPHAPSETAPGEVELWRSFGWDEPAFDLPDIERGRMLGTAARSFAFAGELDRAADLAIEARSLFSGSAFDLAFNASVLARIEAERARLGDPRADRLAALLAMAGVDAPRALRAALERGDLAARFRLDLSLRAMLWAPTVAPCDRWLDSLGADWLFLASSEGEQRSHPSELVARHAGELLRREGREAPARRWLALSVTLCEAATDGSTLHRLGAMSRALLKDDASAGRGRPGSLLNPTFEYR